MATPNLPITLDVDEYDEEYFEIKSFREEGIKDNIQYVKDMKYYYADNMVFTIDMYLPIKNISIKENLSGLTQRGKEFFEKRFEERKDNSMFSCEQLCIAPYTNTKVDENGGVLKKYYRISRTLMPLRIVPLKLNGFTVYKGVDVTRLNHDIFNYSYVLQKQLPNRRIFELPCYEQYNNGIAMVLYEAYKQNIIQPLDINSPYQFLVDIEKVLRGADFPLEEEYQYDYRNKGSSFHLKTLVNQDDISLQDNKVVFSDEIEKRWKPIKNFMILVIEKKLSVWDDKTIMLLKSKYSKNLTMDPAIKENIIRIYLYEQVKNILLKGV